MIGFWIFIGIAVNYFVGCGVCAAIDDEEQRLYHWYCAGPDAVAWLVPFLWPLTAFYWLRRARV